MAQLDFLKGDPGYVTGSDTSEAAAESIAPTAGRLRRQIHLLIASSSAGLTCDEVETALNLSHQTTSARIAELHHHPAHGGRLLRTNERRRTRSGRSAAVYVAAEVGR